MMKKIGLVIFLFIGSGLLFFNNAGDIIPPQDPTPEMLELSKKKEDFPLAFSMLLIMFSSIIAFCYLILKQGVLWIIHLKRRYTNK